MTKLPTDWKQVKLGDCIEKMQGGGTPSKQIEDYWNGDIPWATVKDITKFHPNSTQDYISKNGLENSSSKLIKKGTLIMPTRMALGVAVFFDIDVSINQDLKALNFKEFFNKWFAFYWVQENSLRIKRLGVGSTVDGISQDELKAIKLLLPPLSEQHRIVAVLETWDKTLEKLTRKIELKKNIKKGLMQELLTGKSRLTGFSEEWETVKLGDCISKIQGGGTPSKQVPEYWNGNIPWATVKDITTFNESSSQDFITKEGLQKSSSRLVKKGTLIMPTRMALGVSVFFLIDVAINQDLKSIEFKANIDKWFIYYWIQKKSNYIKKLGVGSTVDGISQEDLKSIKIDIPITKEEQTAIAKILTTADDEITALEKKKQILEEQKKYLLNNLIIGQIRTPENLTRNNHES